ncbi:hypothetical protein [Micromonospora sp. DT47]|uniref:hypothetical protein n=1 Tax=Micromonospora sp. DT47 TaxID=3393431 RepID=UPI003CE72CDF
MSRNEWPQMSPAAVVAFTVPMIGVVIMSGAQSDEMLAALLDLLCTESTCRPVGLAVVGWAVVGGPLVLASLVLLVFSPGAAAQYAMLACVGLMTVGFMIVYAGFDELQGAYPDFGPLGVGSAAAFMALVLGGMIGGPAHLTSWERPRYSSTARLPSAVAPLLAIGVCQVLALAAVLLWAAVLR